MSEDRPTWLYHSPEQLINEGLATPGTTRRLTVGRIDLEFDAVGDTLVCYFEPKTPAGPGKMKAAVLALCRAVLEEAVFLGEPDEAHEGPECIYCGGLPDQHNPRGCPVPSVLATLDALAGEPQEANSGEAR